MRFLSRFGGVMAVLALTIGFAVLGFAAAQPGLLLVSLLCWWPLLWGIVAWVARGLRDHYQLVPKASERPIASAQRPRPQRQAIPEEF